MNKITENALEVYDVTKVFKVPHERVGSLKGHATRLFRKVPTEKYKVLDDINFGVKKGEFFSIIGANGSGKSTLLKMIAGIYEPSKGSVSHDGSMSTLIELGVGFNFELSGRDNIFLNASLFGMTRKQVEAVYDKIVHFAEIEEFIDQKVKNYSSGMQVRLAFAIAIQAHSDIIVVDEVLAVGDANFQQKCFDVFRELKALGKTIVFVSHDLQVVQDFSDRVLLLDHGKQIGIFEPLQAISRYQKINQTELEQADFVQVTDSQEEAKPEIDKAKPHILKVDLINQTGESVKLIKRGESCTAILRINNPTEEELEAGISVRRNDGIYCFGTNTYIEDIKVPTDKVCEVRLRIDKIPLQKGAYYIVAGVFAKRLSAEYELRIKARHFRVTQNDKTEGIIALSHNWEFGNE